MKTISVLQPWASLIAIGAKRIETRSWQTTFRGPLAIHASKKRPPRQGDLPWDTFSTITNAITKALGCWDCKWSNIPLGCVIATCRLVNCIKINPFLSGQYCFISSAGIKYELSQNEYAFGDYTPGRYAWILEDVKLLPEPIPAKGMQGLWEWKETPEVNTGG